MGKHDGVHSSSCDAYRSAVRRVGRPQRCAHAPVGAAPIRQTTRLPTMRRLRRAPDARCWMSTCCAAGGTKLGRRRRRRRSRTIQLLPFPPGREQLGNTNASTFVFVLHSQLVHNKDEAHTAPRGHCPRPQPMLKRRRVRILPKRLLVALECDTEALARARNAAGAHLGALDRRRARRRRRR